MSARSGYRRCGKGCQGDYKRVADAQRIRNSSDYDDFYIADKQECIIQIETVREFIDKASEFLK